MSDLSSEEVKKREFPFNGELFLSRNKKFNETIFFVHFYEGSKRQLLRHIKFVTGLGFDAFAFDLSGTFKDFASLKLPIGADKKFGAKHMYADQIEALLNLLPGKKIVFAFSNPCAAAIEAMARRHCSDTVAMVCDSGPTARFMPSALKLLRQKYNFKIPLLDYALTPVMSFGWSPFLHSDLNNDLKTFPENFPILSIRGWKDELIPPDHIDEVFEPHSQLNWSKLSLPEAAHLTGLRDFKQEYQPGLEAFLVRVATKI